MNKFDDLLTHLGTGPWNLLYFIGASYCWLLRPPQFLSGVYVAPALNYTCLPPQRNESVIAISEDSCSYVSVTQSGTEVEEACTEWDFDNSVFSSTLTSEFSLVCDKSHLRSTYQGVYMFGTFVSPVLGGYLADRYGRKTVIVMEQVFLTLLSIILVFVSNLIAILTIRFFLGAVSLFTFFILALEVCEPKHRATVGILTGLPWALGTMAWGGVAFLIRDWRWLQLAVSLPNVLIFPVLYIIDESPRWLIVRGHHTRALQTLRKAARWNHESLHSEVELRALMKDIQEESVEYRTNNRDTTGKQFRFTVPNLLRTRAIQIITVVMCIDYFAVSFVFDGLNMSGDIYSADPFLYLVLNGLVELPGYTLSAPIITRWGRKMPTVWSYVLSGVVLAVVSFIPSDLPALVLTLALAGKVCITGAFQIISIYSAELFPTEVRLQGIGVASVFGQLASIIVPFITSDLGPLVLWVPSFVFGMASVVAGASTLALRETKDVVLPDTLADLSTTAASSTPEKNADKLLNAALLDIDNGPGHSSALSEQEE